MSPKRIISSPESLPSLDRETPADSVSNEPVDASIATAGPQGSIPDVVAVPGESPSGTAEVVDPPEDEVRKPVRSTPAAQVANRARRIGGAGLAATATLDDADTDRADKVTLTKTDLVDDSARRGRGMAGRPATKSRIAREDSLTADASEGRKFGREAILATVAVVAMLVLAGVNVLVWHPWHKSDATAALRGEILSSVNQATALAISYDYRTWDKSAAAAETNLTGQFKTDYANAMKAQQANATSTKTVAVGKVDNSGLAAINSAGTEATVAVYAERTRTNTTNTDPVTDLLALQIITDKVDGKWKISKLSYIN
ncbi:hypothetical protein SAMN05892883_1779 [Jatrophihabitans sp. GAS493]|uniref:hypothetical protein n=1 Tax=Jatrophihabitans sp. GAS493 TaxID=1907575 RepID=UPI000BB72E60|nr:hypothetical protein [Jatrophihabitans sp. GAS493]SOD72380.1 hypothetical protein SAMN05892883_1779 [Jatrophihabitans sp. GAS493]